MTDETDETDETGTASGTAPGSGSEDGPLRPEEIRVLGCLLEKERLTPDAYPLTATALLAACNQTSSRDPVVRYDEAIVIDALTSLRRRRLIRIVHAGAGSRATRYRQVADEVWGLDDPERAALCVLALRGPQTVGEVKARSERVHAFTDLGAVEATLERLAARPRPLVAELPRLPGQKDARYVHLLAGAPAPDDLPGGAGGAGTGFGAEGTDARPAAPAGGLAELEARVAALEADLAGLRRRLDDLGA
jgi:uncharacterized protein YceH (UPF0502 family)